MKDCTEILKELHLNGINDYYLSHYIKTTGTRVSRETLRDIRTGKTKNPIYRTVVTINKVYKQWLEGQEI